MNKAGARIRRAAVHDFDTVRRIAQESWTRAMAHAASAFEVTEHWPSLADPKAMDRVLQDPSCTCVVAQSGDELLGVGHSTQAERVCDVSHIYVRPDHWGEGIGSQLLTRLELQAYLHEAPVLRSRVPEGNDVALGFYEAHGFQPEETDDDQQVVLVKRLSDRSN